MKLDTLIWYIEDYVSRVESYKNDRKFLPTKCKENDSCNTHFHISDVYLADLINGMKKLKQSQKILSFGVSFSGDFAEKSDLRRKCCACPGNPLSFTRKNDLRAKGERIVYTWLSLALDWLNSDKKDMSELSEKNKVREMENFGTKSKSKFFDYNQ